MIAFFPEPYPDELFYSVLARYYAKSGIPRYAFVAEQLYANKQCVPDFDFINKLSEELMKVCVKNHSMQTIINKHTMFPAYGRFIKNDRKVLAFNDLVDMQGNHKNLLVIPKSKTGIQRVARYCPECAAHDRQLYGETYWHRMHQIVGIVVCPVHRCKLKETSFALNAKQSPTLRCAEHHVPTHDSIELEPNEKLNTISDYILKVFIQDINMESDVLIGDFLDSKLNNTKYKSTRGEQRNIALLYNDFMKYYSDVPNNWFCELHQIQKVFTNYCFNLYEVCLLSLFLGISPEELCNPIIPKISSEMQFDSKIFAMRNLGMNYRQIANELDAAYDTVKAIGEGRYKRPNKKRKNFGGIKRKDWDQIDNDSLPKVKIIVKDIYTKNDNRPEKLSVSYVCKKVGLSPKQIDNMPLCLNEIKNHMESQEQFWAREVEWAVCQLANEYSIIRWRYIRDKINIRKRDLIKCIPFLNDDTMIIVKDLLKSL